MELHGKTILTTRAAAQSSDLRDRLTALGATVIECPTIEIAPPHDWLAVDRAISELPSYDWILFTSANAVEQFMNRVEVAGTKCATPIAVVGSATANKLAQWDLHPALIPADFRAEGLLEAFPANLKNVRILFPRAETARELLPEELRQRGAEVDLVTVYRTVRASTPGQLSDILENHRIDCVVFTSESTIRYLAESLDGDLVPAFKDALVAVIGPVTRQAAEAAGLLPSIQPERATIPDLVSAIRKALSE